jgi:hypothetical protein
MSIYTRISVSISCALLTGEIEYPWYDVWNVVLNTYTPLPPGVIVSPQWCITRRFIDNDDNFKKSSQVPDFCIIKRRVELPSKDKNGKFIDDVPKVSNTLEVLASRIALLEDKILVVVEIKALNKNWNLNRINFEKEKTLLQVKKQVQHVFSRSNQNKVIGIVAIGHYWSSYQFERDRTSPLSDNVDSTYVPREEKLISSVRKTGEGILEICGKEHLISIIRQN